MIRFIPDSWLEAVLRPLAMATPESWVYVEFVAPDLRFLACVVLVIALTVAALRGTRPRTALLALLAVVALAFAIWTASSGNGRYAIPVLLAVGPLCVGLVYAMPRTRAFRLTIAGLLVALQGFLVAQNDPWRWWGLTPWRDGTYFAVELPPDVVQQPANYVTLSSISYSLIAPLFHPDSRWINLSMQRGVNDHSRNAVRARDFLASVDQLTVVFPSLLGENVRPAVISPEMLEALNGILARHRLAIGDLGACRYFPSRSLSLMNARQVPQEAAAGTPNAGFWLCPLSRLSGLAPTAQAVGHAADPVFDRIERSCPRFFPPGGAVTLPIPNGAVRSYVSSDMRLYVLSDGTVAYKYPRALNAEIVGTVETVTANGFKIDCKRVRGRGTLPWEREL